MFSRSKESGSTGSPYTILTSRVTDGENETPHHCAPMDMNASNSSPANGVCVSEELDLEKARRDLIASRLNMAADGLRLAAKKDDYEEVDRYVRNAIADVIVTLELIPDGNDSITQSLNQSTEGTNSESSQGRCSNSET